MDQGTDDSMPDMNNDPLQMPNNENSLPMPPSDDPYLNNQFVDTKELMKQLPETPPVAMKRAAYEESERNTANVKRVLDCLRSFGLPSKYQSPDNIRNLSAVINLYDQMYNDYQSELHQSMESLAVAAHGGKRTKRRYRKFKRSRRR
jgi:hypothetical protein